MEIKITCIKEYRHGEKHLVSMPNEIILTLLSDGTKLDMSKYNLYLESNFGPFLFIEGQTYTAIPKTDNSYSLFCNQYSKYAICNMRESEFNKHFKIEE